MVHQSQAPILPARVFNSKDFGQSPKATPFDVSLILNLHNETRYLRRTMSSLEEAVRFANISDLKVEIVVVLDRPAPSTRDWAQAYDFCAFQGVHVVEVDNGSLGLSRNSGLDLASGEYIGTVDADDLVSFNMFHELYITARSSGPKTIIIQQYVYAFGEDCFVVEYAGTDKVSKLGFFSYHPGVSRIFAHRSLFEELRYSDARLSDGYAYEDWHFNSEAIARGYEFAVARNTVMYYRQRANSLLKSADQISVRQIPPSTYFSPLIFTAVCARDYERYLRADISIKDAQDIRRDFDESATCLELTVAASSIDPAISMQRPIDVPAHSNLSRSLQAGAAYYRLSKLLAGRSFTDVVLMPFISTGGGDKYVLDIIDGLASLDPARRFLVLAGQPFEKHAWTDRLPTSSLFVDLALACEECSELEIQLTTLRIIQTTAPGAVVHLKSSEYAVGFFKRFGRVLPSNEFVFYRFADPNYFHHGIQFCAGYIFNFFSEYGEQLSKVIADNSVIAEYDEQRLDTLAHKWRILPARCNVEAQGRPYGDERAPTRRLLWASRLDPEKRPDLLVKIAAELQARMPGLCIDVFGSQVLDRFDVNEFSAYDNVSYKGPFWSFAQIQTGDYDAFVYTTAFDGLPNVVLEAMAVGLPVIAPDVGGLKEVVATGANGWLIDNNSSDALLTEAYVKAIEAVYASGTDLEAMSANAVGLIRERHSPERFLENLRSIFDVPSRGKCKLVRASAE